MDARRGGAPGARRRKAAALGAALALGLFVPGGAAAPQEERAPVRGPVYIEAADGRFGTDDGRRVLFLTGGVLVRAGEFELRAGRALVWIGPEEPEEIYLEGNVFYTRGTQTLRAERLYFNLAYDRAVVVDLRAQAYSEEFRQGFFVSAREARMTLLGRLDAQEITLTTCSYGVPHYHIEIGRGTLMGREPRPRQGRWDFWPFDDWRFRAEQVYPEIGGAPVFFFPGILVGPWIREFPLRSLTGGRSSRFGVYVYSEFGAAIKKTDGERERTWGDVRLEADWRQKRGAAWGLDLTYRWEGYEGYVDTYYLHDLGRDLDVEFERKFPPLERPQRGRVRAFHRHDLDEHWRWEAEVHYLSDRSLREEFFEREFKEDKEPETAGYVRWIDGNVGGYLLTRHRINDFQTQNEYLPRLDLMILHWPVVPHLLDNLYLTQRVDVSHVRRRFDEAEGLASFRTWRLDLLTEVALPWDLAVLQAAPFARHRTTVYGDDLEGETEVRDLWTVGGRISTQIHATHPGATWELVGLRGLRHVVELEARYGANLRTGARPEELFPFEELEALDEFTEVALALRTRLVTRDRDGRRFDFLRAGIAVEYYPRPARDTGFDNVNTWAEPFYWIRIPSTPAGDVPQRDWSNVHYELALEPLEFVRFTGSGEYNPEARREEARQFDLRFRPLAGIEAAVGHTFFREVVHAWSGGLSWAMTEKWAVDGYVQYDFREDVYLRQSLRVSRDFHDFAVEGVVERRLGRDERRVFIAVVPKFLGGRARRDPDRLRGRFVPSTP